MTSENYWGRVARQRLSRQRALALVGASSAAAAILAACGSDESGTPNTGTNEPTGQATGAAGDPKAGDPKAGGKFGDYFSNMSNYNTIANYHDGFRVSGVTSYDRLLTARLDRRGYVLEAADNVEIAEPTRVVVKLKPGMVFQNKAPVNGRPVVASDIAATQDYVKTLPNAYDSAFQRNSLERVEAPDDSTVVFVLKQPAAYIFSEKYLAHPSSQPIIPKELLATLDTTPAIGSGPYELVDHTFNTKYSYRRFEGYRLAKENRPYITERESVALTDAIAQEAAFRSEQIHAWTAPGSSVDRLETELDKAKFASIAYLSVGQTTINGMMNASLGARPWHDVRVREAFYRLTNREQIVNLSVRNKAVIPTGTLPAALEAYQLDAKETEKFYKFDVAAAKQLLQAANFDFGKEFEVICSSTNSVNAQWAEIWQQQLSAADIKVRIAAMPLSEILPQQTYFFYNARLQNFEVDPLTGQNYQTNAWFA